MDRVLGNLPSGPILIEKLETPEDTWNDIEAIRQLGFRSYKRRLEISYAQAEGQPPWTIERLRKEFLVDTPEIRNMLPNVDLLPFCEED
jgi:hypothetical protein